MHMTRQFAFYVLVGLVALVIDVLCFMLLRSTGLPVHWSNGVSRLIGAGSAYVGNSIWTFKAQQRVPMQWHSVLRYSVMWVVATSLSTVLLVWTAKFAPEAVVKLAVETGMVLINFVVSRYWVYVAR